MKVFSIDITALPLLYIPILMAILAILAIHLYYKTKKKSNLYLGISFFLCTLVAFLPYKYAANIQLKFWSESFHIATIAVVLGLGSSLLFSQTKRIKEQWAFGILILLVIGSFPLPPTVSGTVIGVSLFGYGGYLLFQIKQGLSNEIMRALLFIGISIFGFIGHWFPSDAGSFLFSSLLVLILVHELIKFFERVVLMMKSASVNSITDALTGLYNKGFLYKKTQQLARQQDISIIFADIDNFKQLNDTKGHDFGDVVLKDVGRILKEVIDNKGFACRFGGEEMVGIITKGSANELAELFRQRVEETGVTVSVGVATGKGEGEKLIKKADQYMYNAKKNGKNRVVAYEETIL